MQGIFSYSALHIFQYISNPPLPFTIVATSVMKLDS